MIKGLRRKFIAVTMCSVLAVLTVIMGAINIVNYHNTQKRSDRIIELLLDNNGNFPKRSPSAPHGKPEPVAPDMSLETPYETRFFAVTVNSAGTIVSVNTGSIAAISTSQASEYALDICKSGRQSGHKGFYRYAVKNDGENSLIVFVDCERELSALRSFLITSVIVSFSGAAAVLLLVVFFSRIAVKPVAQTYAKQKRFITDAGHEIKTPLTVIDANTQVLELEYGENEWTKSIRNQVERLSSLTANLISLSRMDEEDCALTMVDFSLSDAVSETIAEFEASAQSAGKDIVTKIDGGISFNGDEQAIRRLVSLLTDNAIKYSYNGSSIKVSLSRKGRQSVLIFANDVEKIDRGNLDILFERFYRPDSSRNSETGGYGIGLSVAKAIVTAHKGTITAESPDGKSIIITAVL